MRHPTRIRQLHGFFEGDASLEKPGMDSIHEKTTKHDVPSLKPGDYSGEDLLFTISLIMLCISMPWVANRLLRLAQKTHNGKSFQK